MAKVHLPSDIVHHIVDALATSMDGYEPSSSTTSNSCTIAWISKDFAFATRKHLFGGVTIDSLQRCMGLLTLIEENPMLHELIRHITFNLSSDYEERWWTGDTESRDEEFELSKRWISSPKVTELMERLCCLSTLTLLETALYRELVDHMAHKTLHPRRHDIIRLNIASCEDISLPELDCVIMHLPALESVWLDGTTCIVMSDQECSKCTAIIGTAAPLPRRMNLKLRFIGHPTMTKLPIWFVGRTYLSSIEELGLDSWNHAQFLSNWQIAIKSSSSLTHLTLTIPDDAVSSSDKRLETLVCPAPTELRLVGGLGHYSHAAGITTVLDSIAPCTATRTIRLDSLKHGATGSYNPVMTSLTTIDDMLIRKFPHLQSVSIQVEWVTRSHGDVYPDEDAVRLAMPGLERIGILQLFFRVTMASDLDLFI
jgi:hypothetical protein